jgi:hypothetical protein
MDTLIGGNAAARRDCLFFTNKGGAWYETRLSRAPKNRNPAHKACGPGCGCDTRCLADQDGRRADDDGAAVGGRVAKAGGRHPRDDAGG